MWTRSYLSTFSGFTSTMTFGKRLTTLTIALMAFVSVAFCYKRYKCYDKVVYVIFEDKFIEPIESMYLLMEDMTLYRVTSNQEFTVNFDMEDLKKEMKKNGHTISDVMIIIHNHYTYRYFSPSDVRAWRSFKREGFTGNFYLYVTTAKTIYELREDEDDG